MPGTLRLSAHCLVDRESHLKSLAGQRSLGVLVSRALLHAQRRLYLTGLGGLAWRLLGVTRFDKNPNLCSG